MKLYVQTFGLIVLALAASGWSSIVAASLCPHANVVAAKAVMYEKMTADHACCKARLESVSKPDCHDSAMGQEAMSDMEPAHVLPYNSRSGASLGLPSAACEHCMGRTELPASYAVARQNVETKRGVEPAAAQSISPSASRTFFTQPVMYRQGAPPGSSTPKHLLISLLLI